MHQRVISEHEGAMLRDIAEFDAHGGLARRRGALHARLVSRSLSRQPRPRPHAGGCGDEGEGSARRSPAPSPTDASRSMCSPRSPPSPRPRRTPTWRRRRSTGRRGRPGSWWPRSRAPRMPRRPRRSSAASSASTTSAAWSGPSSPGTPTPWSSRPWSAGPAATTTRAPTTPTTCGSRAVAPTPWSRSASSRAARRDGPASGGTAAHEQRTARLPVHGGARTTMIVHTDLDRLLYGDGYGHASIQGVGPISAEVARRLACNARHHAVVRRGRRHAASTRRNWSATRARPSGSRSGDGTTDVASRAAAAAT